jgi:hypothetical protein
LTSTQTSIKPPSELQQLVLTPSPLRHIPNNSKLNWSYKIKQPSFVGVFVISQEEVKPKLEVYKFIYLGIVVGRRSPKSQAKSLFGIIKVFR